MSFVAVTANAGRVEPSRRPGTLQENTRREGIRHWHHINACRNAQPPSARMLSSQIHARSAPRPCTPFFFLWNTQSPPTHLMMAQPYMSASPVVERTSTGVLKQRKVASQLQHTRRWPPQRRSTPPPPCAGVFVCRDHVWRTGIGAT